MLGKAQGAVRERRLRLLVRRLRRLVEASCHALEAPAGPACRRGQPTRPGERATLFQGAVKEAIAPRRKAPDRPELAGRPRRGDLIRLRVSRHQNESTSDQTVTRSLKTGAPDTERPVSLTKQVGRRSL
jgi:hypothetical protein